MEHITLSIAEIVKILNKGYYKGADVSYINFRSDKGLNTLQIELGFSNPYIFVFSEERFKIHKNNCSRPQIDVSDATIVFSQSVNNYNNHFKSIVSILNKSKKDASFEIILFNDCDLYRNLDITSHEMYLNLFDSKDRLERHLVEKFVGKQNGASPLYFF